MFKKIMIRFAVALIMLTACSKSSGKSGDLGNVTSAEVQFQKPEAGDTVAVIKTSRGTVKVILFPELAPKAVENFKQLASSGYYDGITFHRVIENFVVQSGSPDGSSGGGQSCWGVPFTDEFTDLLHNYTGALSMANHGSDTNGSQFFFVVTPVGQISDSNVSSMQSAGWREEVIDTYKQAGGVPSLDYRYTVFGQDFEGLDVLYKISEAKTDENDRPLKDITIESVEVYVLTEEDQ